MNETFRLGRMAGVRIGVNWTAAIMAALVAYLLADSYLPSRVAGQNRAVYWLVGIGVGTLFLASLLAHELAHAVVARHEGERVEGVTLWLLGGVTKLSDEPNTPGADFRIAIAGPVTSLLIGGLITIGGLISRSLAGPELLTAALLWLGWINIFLAVFNLLPAAPLDGGRVLRAAVWARTADRQRGIQSANRAGVIMGWILVAFGVFDALAGALLGGLWLALIGVFVIGAARAEQQQAQITETFSGLRVRDVMNPDPVVVPGWLTVDAIIARFVSTHDATAYPVQDCDGDIVGLLQRDRILALTPGQRATTRADAVALPRTSVATANPEEPLGDLLARMTTRSASRHALVFAGDTLVGIVSLADINEASVRIRLGLSARTAENDAGNPAMAASRRTLRS